MTEQTPKTTVNHADQIGDPKADHLCVLVHGFWGSPKHMESIAKQLRASHPSETLNLLLAKSNSEDLTYDGIELGGERVCAEIEQEMKRVQAEGGKIQKLSVIGYSLGGLIARYAVGLLGARGTLDQIECKNFITFASPHLGVRSPLNGVFSSLFNGIGPRTLSASGRQLFLLDTFRDTGRPLISVLADPASIFVSGLRKFQRRTLYGNITNDTSAAFYTTNLSKTDPYSDLNQVELNYLEGSEKVILDPDQPFKPVGEDREPPTYVQTGIAKAKQASFAVMVTALFPLGLTMYLSRNLWKSSVSAERMRLYEEGKGGVDPLPYRVPTLLQEIRGDVDDVYERINAAQKPDYLAPSTSDEGLEDSGSESDGAKDQVCDVETKNRRTMKRERRASLPHEPTLALAPEQFDMIDSLNSLGWRKYPVHIHKIGHSHAAIIVRWEKESFSEGWIVLRHMVDKEFLS